MVFFVPSNGTLCPNGGNGPRGCSAVRLQEGTGGWRRRAKRAAARVCVAGTHPPQIGGGRGGRAKLPTSVPGVQAGRITAISLRPRQRAEHVGAATKFAVMGARQARSHRPRLGSVRPGGGPGGGRTARGARRSGGGAAGGHSGGGPRRGGGDPRAGPNKNKAEAPGSHDARPRPAPARGRKRATNAEVYRAGAATTANGGERSDAPRATSSLRLATGFDLRT